MASEVEVGPWRRLVLLAVAGREGDAHHTFPVAAGQPPFHVVLGAVQLPPPSLVRQAVRYFAHPGQRMEVRVCPRVGVLLKMDMHFSVSKFPGDQFKIG